MNFARIALTAASLAGALGSASLAHAVTIQPVAVSGSSSFPSYEDDFAIDSDPLSDWASQGMGAATTLAIDLGGIFSLTSGSFTDRTSSGGSNNSSSFGTTDFTTAFTVQACQTFACNSFISPALLFGKPTPVAPNEASDFTYTAALAGLTGRFFLYSVTAANGPNPGLAEVSFEGISAVPEPATWALMILGFGIVGSALRRRRTQVRFNFA